MAQDNSHINLETQAERMRQIVADESKNNTKRLFDRVCHVVSEVCGRSDGKVSSDDLSTLITAWSLMSLSYFQASLKEMEAYTKSMSAGAMFSTFGMDPTKMSIDDARSAMKTIKGILNGLDKLSDRLEEKDKGQYK